MRLPTDIEIEKAKREIVYPIGVSLYCEHLDCVRIAFAWLDTQRRLKRCVSVPSKGKIAGWSGRHISFSDVYLAAHLHPDIIVKGRKMNISRNDTKPLTSRLIGIGEAGKHPNYFHTAPSHENVEEGISVMDILW